MPQMSPIMWVNSLILISTIMLVTNSQNYFLKKIKPKKMKVMMTSKLWKW